MNAQRLYINVDHVATVRQARRGESPDPVAAAIVCERAGADGITAHLREDRRHIQDDDIERLSATGDAHLDFLVVHRAFVVSFAAGAIRRSRACRSAAIV